MGQSRRFGRGPVTSDLPRTADDVGPIPDFVCGTMSDIEQLLEFSQSVQITLKLWGLNKKGG
jgi:hypothetical protein